MASNEGVKTNSDQLEDTKVASIPASAIKKRKPGRPKKDIDEPEQYISFHLRNQDRIDKYESISEKLASKDGRYKRTVNVMRYIIDLVYRVEMDDKGKMELDDVLDKRIELILSNEFLKNSYNVSDLKTVINKAVEDWLKNKKSDINLHNWDFRKHLGEDEKRVAMAFVENQMKPEHFKGLSVDELDSYLTGMDARKVRQVVRSFLKNHLIETDQVDGNDYYYAPLP